MLRIFIAELSRNLLLKFECEHVGIAAGIKVKKVANAVMEFQGVFGNRVPVTGFQRLSNPPGPMHIAQGAGRLLQIGFELINCVAKQLVPGRLHFREQFDEAVPILLNQSRHNLSFEFQCGCGVA